MSDEQVATTAKAKTEYVDVKLTDGRTVQFAGKRKMLKEVVQVGDRWGTRFDYVNGETRTYLVPTQHVGYASGHGLGQKLGDKVAGMKDEQGNPASTEDMVLSIDELYSTLEGSDSWNVETRGGAATGGSIIIKAMAEALQIPVDQVRARIEKRLADSEAKGEKLSRQALYKSYRKTATLAPIIKRLEDEAAANEKSTLNGEDELATLAVM